MVEINILLAALLRGIYFSFDIQNKQHTDEKILTPNKGGNMRKFMLLNLRYNLMRFCAGRLSYIFVMQFVSVTA